MSAIRVSAIGGLVSAAAFTVSLLADGLLGDASWLVTLFAAVVTLGLLTAIGLESLSGTHGARTPRPSRWSKKRRVPAATQAPACGSCRRQMTQVEGFWICAQCDRVRADT